MNEIRLGAQVIQIVEVDQLDDDAIGEAHYRKSEIHVLKGQPPRILLDTLIHEMIHHMNFVNGWSGKLDSDEEEHLTTVLAGQFAELFVRNPDFIKRLQKLAR